MAKSGSIELKHRRRRPRSGILYIPIVVLLVLLLMIVGISVFFRVSEIQVEGADFCSEEEIENLSGIAIGDNVFFINESKAAVKICNGMPYVDEIKILREMPGRIIIQISESYPIAAVEFDGQYLILDRKCKVLEITNAEGAMGKILITGVDPVEPAVGKILDFGEAGTLQLNYLCETLSSILSLGIYGDISEVDMSNVSDIQIAYQGRFTVELGRGENVENKIQMLQSVISQLDSNEKGTIIITNEAEAHFIPEREPADTDDTPDDAEPDGGAPEGDEPDDDEPEAE